MAFAYPIQARNLCEPETFKVAIDIGHTPRSGGAISARGKPEYEFNRQMASELRDELVKRGFQSTILINETAQEISLRSRTRVAHKHGAKLFISIHHDSVQPKYLSRWTVDGVTRRYSDRFSGYSLFYSNKNPWEASSKAFAFLLGEELLRRGHSPSLHHAEPIRGENRPLIDERLGVYRFDDLVVLKTALMPAVLVECGIIVNRDEELALTSTEFRNRINEAILAAVESFCELPQ